MKLVALHTLGCKLNYVETASIGQQFEEKGYKITTKLEDADIVVINTCTVTQNADRECRQIIRRAIRKSPNALLVVTGCYSQLQANELAKIKGVDIVLGNHEKQNIFDYLKDLKKKNNTEVFVSCLNDFVSASSAGIMERTRAFIKVQDGCDYNCSFCTIPIARGKSRSASVEEIINKTKEAAEKGYKEIVLTGVNVGDYGRKNNSNLLFLLKYISEIDGIERIRISSIEPNLLSDELLDYWVNNKKLCKHWHIPLQSGSDTILRMMKRRYKKGLFVERVEKIKSIFPLAGIGTDVIVGFPGETDEFFQDTIELIKEMPISYVHVFSYSERPNTHSVSYYPKISAETKTNRSKILHKLSDEKRRLFYSNFIGKKVAVLFESVQDNGFVSGLTEEYVRVLVRTEKDIANQIMIVEIKKVLEDKCIGEIIDTASNNSMRIAI